MTASLLLIHSGQNSTTLNCTWLTIQHVHEEGGADSDRDLAFSAQTRSSIYQLEHTGKMVEKGMEMGW